MPQARTRTGAELDAVPGVSVSPARRRFRHGWPPSAVVAAQHPRPRTAAERTGGAPRRPHPARPRFGGPTMKRLGMLMACAAAALVWGGPPAPAAEAARGGGGGAEASPPRAEGGRRADRARRPAPRVERGKASYYAPRLAGRRMADGGRSDPRADAAAHRSLPLGSKARVRNLENGRSATVTVRDRGPHAPGRVVDVSPGTAEQLGMKGEGVAPVEVAPVETPRAGGQAAEPGPGPGSAASGGGPGRRRR